MDYGKLSREDLIAELRKRDSLISEFRPHIKFELPNLRNSDFDNRATLDLQEIKRYSRQLILPEIGLKGQCKLKCSSVLIVGCGGLGCPAAIYLAAAGIGCLGLIDYDDIEESNLHRQILHAEHRIGSSKAQSVCDSIRKINCKIKCIPYEICVSRDNIMDVISNYDVVLDCTDNVATRYLLNDACVFSKKPLVSGSALRFDGQLTVYGYQDGPCYRCLFPEPPPPETVTNCSDGGVLGAVPGVIGCLQALETVKLIAGFGDLCSKKLLLFDGLSLSFRQVRLRNRVLTCRVCGNDPSIKSLIDYEQFCGSSASDKEKTVNLLKDSDRITVHQLKNIMDKEIRHILIDVRNPVELEICCLNNTINIPLSKMHNDVSIKKIAENLGGELDTRVICVCKRGNDSQKAASFLRNQFPGTEVCDVIGGLNAWAAEIDNTFPTYW